MPVSLPCGGPYGFTLFVSRNIDTFGRYQLRSSYRRQHTRRVSSIHTTGSYIWPGDMSELRIARPNMRLIQTALAASVLLAAAASGAQAQDAAAGEKVFLKCK